MYHHPETLLPRSEGRFFKKLLSSVSITIPVSCAIICKMQRGTLKSKRSALATSDMRATLRLSERNRRLCERRFILKEREGSVTNGRIRDAIGGDRDGRPDRNANHIRPRTRLFNRMQANGFASRIREFFEVSDSVTVFRFDESYTQARFRILIIAIPAETHDPTFKTPDVPEAEQKPPPPQKRTRIMPPMMKEEKSSHSQRFCFVFVLKLRPPNIHNPLQYGVGSARILHTFTTNNRLSLPV